MIKINQIQDDESNKKVIKVVKAARKGNKKVKLTNLNPKITCYKKINLYRLR